MSKYKASRHNVGFMVIDKLVKQLSLRFVRYDQYHIAQSNDGLSLIKPMLYMNNSGIIISEYLNRYGSVENFIVVYDDLALPLGRIRIREKGSDGGHQGMASIIYHLKTIDFPRMRIGISMPADGESTTDYVLSNFSETEKPVLNQITDIACDALLMIKSEGIKTTMNKYNPIDVSVKPEAN
ncbi:MAG: aminoacyl-tRNA hydrolase [Candidatus Latescibacteria bacterium]|nr:aminoacyl-tRNA hydrolase [Candidatus Latescibacterota bacterium]